MPDQKLNGPESPVAQHVRKVLAQISLLKARLRGQEQTAQSGSRDTVEVEHEDDKPSRIDGTDLPA
jgi:hypothetical protein